MEEYKYTHKTDLIKRFISDFNLPIPITEDKSLFEYYLGLYQNYYRAADKWEYLTDEIDTNFLGNTDAFLKHYYDSRDALIEKVKQNPHFIEFNNSDMSRFAVKIKDFTNKKLYCEDNCSKMFLSIDLKQAQIQALNFCDKEILKADTFEEFASDYGWYISNSKYTRQVIFGQLNPSRQITVEKYITNKIRLLLAKNNYLRQAEGGLLSFANDELIYIIEAPLAISVDVLERKIQDELGIKTRITKFVLEKLTLCNSYGGRKTFYAKLDIDKFKYDYKTIPVSLMPIVRNLLNGEDIDPRSRIVYYDGLPTELIGDYWLE